MIAVLANMAESALAARPARGRQAVIRGEQKVTGAHLERAAIVYVRQSTLMQVREHTESTLRQYDLAGQAARLGWAGTASR